MVAHGVLKDAHLQISWIVILEMASIAIRPKNSAYFMDTFFHHPDELRSEVTDAVLSPKGVFGVERTGLARV